MEYRLHILDIYLLFTLLSIINIFNRRILLKPKNQQNNNIIYNLIRNNQIKYQKGQKRQKKAKTKEEFNK